MYYVYILKGKNKHYIGCTNNIERRMKEHKLKKIKIVKSMKEVELLGYFEKESGDDARRLEKIIKRNGHIDYRINHKTFITFQ
ncbi:MAG: GIY-YIG nuclease family protein [Candidatus Absconditabacteria bacterium]